MVCIAIYGQRKQFRNGPGVQLSGFVKKRWLGERKAKRCRRGGRRNRDDKLYPRILEGKLAIL